MGRNHIRVYKELANQCELVGFYDINKDTAQKIMQQMVAYGLATILFGVLAASSTAVEFMTCTSVSCTIQTKYMAQHIWIFVGLSMISGVLFFFKALETMNYITGRNRG